MKPITRPVRLLAPLFALLLLAACSAGGKTSSTITAGEGGSSTEAKAESSDADPRGVETPGEDDEQAEDTESDSSSTKAEIEVVEAGFSVYTAYDDKPRATAAAVLENTGEEMATFFEVIFVFKDADEKPVGTETVYVDALGGGGTGYTGVSSVEITGDVASIDVSAVFDPDGSFWGEGIVVPVTVENVEAQEYGDGVYVHGIAENPTDEILEHVGVSCVLRTADDIVGYARGYLDTMVAGASISWDASGEVRADAAECLGSRHG